MRKRFYDETLSEIVSWAIEALASSQTIKLEVFNPDLGRGLYSGEAVERGDIRYLYRGIKAWSDLGELLQCRMLLPQPLSDHTVEITYEKLDPSDSFHRSPSAEEKYGVNSPFARIHKNEEPAFLHSYRSALNNVRVGQRRRILDLGINTGDEFDLIRTLLPAEEYSNLSLVGIDHSKSAIDEARRRFPEGNATFYAHDINDLASLNPGQFDLIITIGTLQSTTLDFKPLFASLVQNYLAPDGAMIIGFPNCRWMDGEMIYGAKPPNYPYAEMSILIKDVYYCKKYLQQKKFRVTVTGKDYLFLTATKISAR